MPQPKFFKLPLPTAFRKWLGYVDQYLIFPLEIRKKLNGTEKLFVFTDQALGPWVPLVADRPHVIHCHDFLAQRSAEGEIPENQTRWTGKKYQKFIRSGYSTGKNFISVSHSTKQDLHRFLSATPLISEVVHNGLNQSFTPINPDIARHKLGEHLNMDLNDGYILHVGGNQWYKNRKGVMEIYQEWRTITKMSIPLLMIGEGPDPTLKEFREMSPFKSDIYFLSGLKDEYVRLAYSGALLFVYPSLAEGFGWPIAEAMASGCPVITTEEAPMTEVAGKAGIFISRRPEGKEKQKKWSKDAALIMDSVIKLGPEARKAIIEAGIRNAGRFNSEVALDKIEGIYQKVLMEQ